MFCIFQLNFQRTKSKAINFRKVIYSVLLKTQHSKLPKSHVHLIYGLQSTIYSLAFPQVRLISLFLHITHNRRNPSSYKKIVKNYLNCQRTHFRQVFCMNFYTCAFNYNTSNTQFRLKFDQTNILA